MRDPVTIVGAGPAGLTAAIVLRKRGFPVRIYEKNPDVGHRLNGDFQGLENWSTDLDVVEHLNSLGIETNFLCVPFRGGVLYAPSMGPERVISDRPIYYLVRRGAVPGSLDLGLKEQASALGVEFVFNHRINDFADMCIVGTGPPGAEAIAVGMTFSTTCEDMAVAVFNDEIAPRGYAYLLVHNGFGTMATVMYSDFSREKELFDRMTDFFRTEISLDIQDPKRFSGYATFFLGRTRVLQKSLYIGESAGFQDFLWGFGMRYAFMSGYLAARSIIDNTDYDLLWKRDLKPMLETSVVNRFLIEAFGRYGYRYLARKLVSGDPREFLRRHYNCSFSKQLLLPFAKFILRRRVGAHGKPVRQFP